ncbi:unnamed protein product [Urochloa humidicola]
MSSGSGLLAAASTRPDVVEARRNGGGAQPSSTPVSRERLPSPQAHDAALAARSETGRRRKRTGERRKEDGENRAPTDIWVP